LNDEFSKTLDDLKKNSLQHQLEVLKSPLEALKSPLDNLGINSVLKELESATSSFKNPLDGIGRQELFEAARYMEPMNYRMPQMPIIKSAWETQAELFMEGLRKQVHSLEKSLKADEELVMTCWHGHEKFQVLSVSMPSQNVVALHCVDAEDNHSQITGHMNAVTFSFKVCKIQPPAKPKKIGFSMPTESAETDE
jgi:hypothetical protein